MEFLPSYTKERDCTSFSHGFTLIELLVVIAIIGILSSVVLVSVSGSQKKGRDGRRVSDIKQIQLALSLYYEANTDYPAGTTQTTSFATILGSTIAPSFISVLPNDPTSGKSYGYVAQPGGCDNNGTICSGYVLAAQLETNNPALDTSYKTAQTITVNGAAADCSTTQYLYCVKE
jgi:prepilin-type N-terminal cleavage/methylation domain-containing protein